jgi:hypothetical protein
MENTQPGLDVAPVAGPPSGYPGFRRQVGPRGTVRGSPARCLAAATAGPPRSGSRPAGNRTRATPRLARRLHAGVGVAPVARCRWTARFSHTSEPRRRRTPSRHPGPGFGGGDGLDDLLRRPPDLPAHGELELDPGTGTPGWSEVSSTSLGGNEIELASDLPSVELDRHPPPEPEAALAADLSWSVPATSAPAAPEPALPGGDWSLAPPGPPPPALVSPAQGAPPVAGSSGSGFDDPFSDFSASPRPPRGRQRRGARRGVSTLTCSTRPRILSKSARRLAVSALSPTSPRRRGPSPRPWRSSPPDRCPPSPGAGPRRAWAPESERPGCAARERGDPQRGLAALLLLVVGVVSSWATAGRVRGPPSPRAAARALRSGPASARPRRRPARTRRARAVAALRPWPGAEPGAPPGGVRVRAGSGTERGGGGERWPAPSPPRRELWRPRPRRTSRRSGRGCRRRPGRSRTARGDSRGPARRRESLRARLKVTASVDR